MGGWARAWMAGGVLVTLVGCGDDGDSASTTTSGETEITATTEAEITARTETETHASGSASGSGSGDQVVDLDGVNLVAPSDWGVQEGVAFEMPGTGLSLPGAIVSPDPASWLDDWAITGAFVTASTDLAAETGTAGGGSQPLFALAEWHGSVDLTDCDRDGASLFGTADGQLSGFVTYWTNCGGIGVTLLDVAVIPEDGSVVVVAEASGAEGDELEVIEALLASLTLD